MSYIPFFDVFLKHALLHLFSICFPWSFVSVISFDRYTSLPGLHYYHPHFIEPRRNNVQSHIGK